MPPKEKNEVPDASHVHDLQIQELKMDMAVFKQSSELYYKDIRALFELMQGFQVSLVKIENSVDNVKDIPDKVRKLEDKSIITDLIKVSVGIVVGTLMSGYISTIFIANKEKHVYKIERTENTRAVP